MRAKRRLPAFSAGQIPVFAAGSSCAAPAVKHRTYGSGRGAARVLEYPKCRCRKSTGVGREMQPPARCNRFARRSREAKRLLPDARKSRKNLRCNAPRHDLLFSLNAERPYCFRRNGATRRAMHKLALQKGRRPPFVKGVFAAAFGCPAGAAGQQKPPGHRGLLGIFHRSCAQPAAAHIPPFCLERATACPQGFCHGGPCAWPWDCIFYKRRGLHAVLPALQRFFG